MGSINSNQFPRSVEEYYEQTEDPGVMSVDQMEALIEIVRLDASRRGPDARVKVASKLARAAKELLNYR